MADLRHHLEQEFGPRNKDRYFEAQIAALLEAHIIKVKMPTAHLKLPDARKVYEDQKIPRDTAADRVRHVVQSAFNDGALSSFSGGPKESDEAHFVQRFTHRGHHCRWAGEVINGEV